MKDSKQRFSNRVENYIRYRPDYPKAIVRDLESKHFLNKTDALADIGSGTGISTELFLSHGYACSGVEPNCEMRSAAENQLSRYRHFISINGNAEAIALKSESADCILLSNTQPESTLAN